MMTYTPGPLSLGYLLLVLSVTIHKSVTQAWRPTAPGRRAKTPLMNPSYRLP